MHGCGLLADLQLFVAVYEVLLSPVPNEVCLSAPPPPPSTIDEESAEKKAAEPSQQSFPREAVPTTNRIVMFGAIPSADHELLSASAASIPSSLEVS